MIEVTTLTKRYGRTLAVDELTFTVRPGQVTGFLGPNGAGKSTTMRTIVGLDRPTSGRATVDGVPYRDQPAPLCAVGTLLDAKALHKGRTAVGHLRALAQTHGIPDRRVTELLELTGLGAVAQVGVAGVDLAPGVDDGDHRLAGEVGAVVAHLERPRAVAEGPQVVDAVPAVAA